MQYRVESDDQLSMDETCSLQRCKTIHLSQAVNSFSKTQKWTQRQPIGRFVPSENLCASTTPIPTLDTSQTNTRGNLGLKCTRRDVRLAAPLSAQKPQLLIPSGHPCRAFCIGERVQKKGQVDTCYSIIVALVCSRFIDSQFVDSIKIVPTHIDHTAPNVWDRGQDAVDRCTKIAASRE